MSSLPESKSDDECMKPENSLDAIALQMARFSHADAIEKTRHVLSMSTYFYIDLRDPLFTSTTQNLITMLEGYGLTQVTSNIVNSDVETVIMLENSFHSALEPASSCVGSRCATMPRIVIQTEQERPWLAAYLRACHRSPTCVIFEFSDYNVEWEVKKHKLSSSIFLLPHMVQNRLDHLVPTNLTPIDNRTLDVVHFGWITQRRATFKAVLESELNETALTMEWEMNLQKLANAYGNAKICLIIHAYSPLAAGEFHRLSDFAKFGCVPVVESFGDQVGMEIWAKCAGLIMADYNNLLSTITQVLQSKKHFQDIASRTKWWNKGINWSKLLPTIFEMESNSSDEKEMRLHENVFGGESKAVAFVTGYTGHSTNANIPVVPSRGNSFFINNLDALAERAHAEGWVPVHIDMGTIDLLDYVQTTMAGKPMKVFPQTFVPNGTQYDFVVWFDNKFNVNVKGTFDVVHAWDPVHAVVMHKHPFLCCGADLEFMESMKQDRYLKQKHQYLKYIAEEQVQGFPVHGERHFQTGFIVYNLHHEDTQSIQSMWMGHIHRCGIQCQISMYFVAQRFPTSIGEFIPPVSNSERIAMEGWPEDTFHEQLEVGRRSIILNEPMESVLKELLAAYDMRPSRA